RGSVRAAIRIMSRNVPRRPPVSVGVGGRAGSPRATLARSGSASQVPAAARGPSRRIPASEQYGLANELHTRSRVFALALSIVVASAAGGGTVAAQDIAPPASAGVAEPVAATVVEPVQDVALSLAPAAPVSHGRWRGGILFDEDFRAAIRLSA